jgi:hypothetical protein
MTQNNISRLEDPDYGKHTISSLKRLADALDVALVVRFVPFSQYIDWLSGTPHVDMGLRPEALAVPSFEEEEKQGRYESAVAFWGYANTVVTPQLLVSNYIPLTTGFAVQEQIPGVTELRGVYTAPFYVRHREVA